MLSGTYVLVLKLSRDSMVNVGSLGCLLFEKGYYAYIGSGGRNVFSRVKRHFSRTKKVHWHIDYLTLLSDAIPLAYYYVPKSNIEETLSVILSKHLNYVEGFGSSDTKAISHMFYSKDLKKLLRWIVRAMLMCLGGD